MVQKCPVEGFAKPPAAVQKPRFSTDSPKGAIGREWLNGILFRISFADSSKRIEKKL